MRITTFKVDGKEFVVLPRTEFERLKADKPTPRSAKAPKRRRTSGPTAAQIDAGDLAEARRPLADSTDEVVPYDRVAAKLGLQ